MIDPQTIVHAYSKESYVVRGEHRRILGVFDTLPEAATAAKGTGYYGADAKVEAELVLFLKHEDGSVTAFTPALCDDTTLFTAESPEARYQRIKKSLGEADEEFLASCLRGEVQLKGVTIEIAHGKPCVRYEESFER